MRGIKAFANAEFVIRDSEFAKTVQEAGHKIIRSAFPKPKFTWYTAILDDTYTEGDIRKLLIAAYDQAK